MVLPILGTTLLDGHSQEFVTSDARESGCLFRDIL